MSRDVLLGSLPARGARAVPRGALPPRRAPPPSSAARSGRGAFGGARGGRWGARGAHGWGRRSGWGGGAAGEGADGVGRDVAANTTVPGGLLALSQSIWDFQLGEPGLFSAPRLTDLYRKTRTSTCEMWANTSDAELRNLQQPPALEGQVS